MKKVVIALGGNAILQPGQKGSFAEQYENVYQTCVRIVKIVKDGYSIVLTHGNGPQVGNIIVQNEEAKDKVPPMPLYVLGAQSQGMIGFMMQNSMEKLFNEAKIDKQVVTLVTQVEVDKKDKAFENPSKPVGLFYSESVAKEAMESKGENWIEDAGRGWRKVVPSPLPTDIVEKNAVKKLYNDGYVVIASGGGGIPVVKNESGSYDGVEAVIDKDLAAEKLAAEIDADILMILTDVENVMLNYKQENEIKLTNVDFATMERYMEEGHFKKGSMGPKVQACLKFVQSTHKKAIITSLDNALDALEGKSGTTIYW